MSIIHNPTATLKTQEDLSLPQLYLIFWHLSWVLKTKLFKDWICDEIYS